MAKFDYMTFSDGYFNTEFVVHAGKFTKEEAIRLFIQEYHYKFKPESCIRKLLRKPTIDDVIRRQVKYFPRTPDYCGYDDLDRGCYTFCNRDARGSFPVWVIEFANVAATTDRTMRPCGAAGCRK